MTMSELAENQAFTAAATRTDIATGENLRHLTKVPWANIGSLNTNEWACDIDNYVIGTNDTLDLRVKVAATLTQMNNGDVTFSMGQDTCDNIQFVECVGLNHDDWEKAGEGHGLVFDDHVTNSGMTDCYSAGNFNIGFSNNGGINNTFLRCYGHHNGHSAGIDRDYHPNKLSIVTLTDCSGQSAVPVTDAAEGITITSSGYTQL